MNCNSGHISPFHRLVIVICTSVLAFVFLINISTKKVFDGHLQKDAFIFDSWDSRASSLEHARRLIKTRMQIAQKIVKYGTEKIPTSDPFALYSLWFMFEENGQCVNASIHNMLLYGLSNLSVNDVAVNTKTKDSSVLLQANNIRIVGTYQMSVGNDRIDDKGKMDITVKKWSTTWSANILNETDETFIVTRKTVKSFYDNATEKFHSSMFDNKYPQHYKSVIAHIMPMIMRKVREAVDERLASVLNQVFVEQVQPPTYINLEDFIQEYKSRQKRQVPCEKGEELDEYVDSLFRFASRVVRAMEPFGLPNATIDLPEYNLKLFLYMGGATRAYTLQRRRPAWVFCSNESVSLGLTVGFEEVRVKYKFKAIHDWMLLFNGELEAMLRDTKLQVQFTQTTPEEDSEEKVQQRVDRIRIWRLGKVRIIIRGLGNLSQGLSMFLTNFINQPQNQEQLEPTLREFERQGITFANRMLQNISVPFFSII